MKRSAEIRPVKAGPVKAGPVKAGPVKIRPADLQDLPDAVRIVEDATREMNQRGIHQWDEVYPNKTILCDDIEKQSMYVLEAGGRVAGLAVINEEQSPGYEEIPWTFPGRALVVHRLVVHPAHQRSGFAGLLMDFVECLAVRECYDCIRLDAFTQNPGAMALYENRGYHNAGVVSFRKGQFVGYEKQASYVVHPDAGREDGGEVTEPLARGGE